MPVSNPEIEAGGETDGIISYKKRRVSLKQIERSSRKFRRHDAQVRLFEADYIKSARYPVLEPRPLGRRKELPDISALSSRGRRLMNMNIRCTTFLCPSQVRGSKPEIRQTALLATRSAACL